MTNYKIAFSKMNKNIFAVLILVSWSFSLNLALNIPPGCEDICRMKFAVKALIRRNPKLHPKLLRLGFHDCVGTRCDGCINLGMAENKGLDVVVQKLDKIYDVLKFHQFASKADFYALAAILSAQQGFQNSVVQGKNCQPPCIQTYWGRQDVTTCPRTDPTLEFPEGSMNASRIFDYFRRRFDMNKQETAALMGAHSMGMAMKDNSGYQGLWTPGEQFLLDNQFYASMNSHQTKWENKNVATEDDNPKWQYFGTKRIKGGELNAGFMLNTDFAVFYDLETNPAGQATCDVNIDSGTLPKCDPSETFNLAVTYANNCTRFMGDFSIVLGKILRHGYNDNNLLTGPTNCSCRGEFNACL